MPRKDIEGPRLPNTWRSDTEKYIRRDHGNYCLAPSDSVKGKAHLREALRILYRDEAERAYRYLIDAASEERGRFRGKFGPVDFAQYIAICALGLPSPKDIRSYRKYAAEQAESIRRAWRDIVAFLDPGPEKLKKLERQIEFYEYWAKNYRLPGGHRSRSSILIDRLVPIFRWDLGRPVYEAVTALLRATIPGERYDDVETVKTIASRIRRRTGEESILMSYYRPIFPQIANREG